MRRFEKPPEFREIEIAGRKVFEYEGKLYEEEPYRKQRMDCGGAPEAQQALEQRVAFYLQLGFVEVPPRVETRQPKKAKGGSAGAALAPWKAYWRGLTPKWKSALKDALELDAAPRGDDLQRLSTITSLELHEADIGGDPSPLGTLHTLERLNLYGTGLRDVRPIGSLVKLRELALGNNPDLVDVSPLSTLSELEWLDIGSTGVRDLAPLASLSKLRVLLVGGLDAFAGFAAQRDTLQAALPQCRISAAE